MALTTRDMSDAHEIALVDALGGRRMKGSGNQWHNPMDGRQNSRSQYYAFAWDGKSTLGKSVGVTREMWTKAREQAYPLKPMLALRWYTTERLDVGQDLVVLDLATFALVLADANAWQAAREQGCLTGSHSPDETHFECSVCGVSMFDAS